MTAHHPGTTPATPPLLAVDLVSTPDLIGRAVPLARALEAAGIGAITITDGGLHPVHVAASLAPATTAIALIPRTDAVYVEPFHLATQLQALDHVSAGRAGWLVEAGTDEAAAVSVGRELLDADATARETSDVIGAARLLWDSWADDAVVRDVENGLYLDATRLQYADVVAETFSVRGPSITPRSPQGLVPVLVADGDADAVGSEAAGLADGRVLDVHVAPGAEAGEIAGALRAALTGAGAGAGADGSAAGAGGSAAGAGGSVPGASGVGAQGSVAPGSDAPGSDAPSLPTLVRLIGLDPVAADLPARISAAASALQDEGLLAPAPIAGATLWDQLGRPRPEVVIDPARRSDRARRTGAAA